MAYQSSIEFASCRKVPMPEFGAGLDHSQDILSALEEEICLLDTVIPLSSIPDWAMDRVEDRDVWNIFAPDLQTDTAMEMATDMASEPANPIRAPRQSRPRQSRLIALRRRAARTVLRQSPAARKVWRATGNTDLKMLRSCIYEPPAAEDAPSLPLRLTTHAMSMALIITALPVGVGLLTYSLLKGEDIKTTARLTTLTGLALIVVAGNPQLLTLFGA